MTYTFLSNNSFAMSTILAPLFDERRTAQAAAYLLYRASGVLPLIKLVKLMYLAERLSWQRYGEPITGDKLVSMAQFFHELTIILMEPFLLWKEGGKRGLLVKRAMT